MRISQLHIHNFRSIADMTLEVLSQLVLLGPNNHGKSNVLKAGGVGGLLAVTVFTASDQSNSLATYYPCCDANGNITEYIIVGGVIAAHREYSAFGESTVLAGTLADSFNHWWSTKPWCKITNLKEYVFRKYAPTFGRWLSRDPIGELISLSEKETGAWGSDDQTESFYYAFRNNPLNSVDVLGLLSPCQEWKQKNPGDVKGDWGGVVCKDGEKHFCIWTPPGTNPGIDFCVGQHEKTHADDVTCPPCGLDRPGFDSPDAKKQNEEECNGYQAELSCLQKEEPYRCNKLKGNAKNKCLHDFKSRIDFVRCVELPSKCHTPKPKDCK